VDDAGAVMGCRGQKVSTRIGLGTARDLP
jgi:hypothetical protein